MPTNADILREWRGDATTFIETGTYRGDGVRAAFDAGFDHVVTIGCPRDQADDRGEARTQDGPQPFRAAVGCGRADVRAATPVVVHRLDHHDRVGPARYHTTGRDRHCCT